MPGESSPSSSTPGPPEGPASPVPEAVSFLEAHRAEYAGQVKWFLVVRVLLVLACLVILLIYEEGSPRIFAAAHVTLIGAMGLAALHLLVLRLAQDLERVVWSAVVVDVAVTTALAYLTGGILNIGFAYLYFAAILSAVLLLSDRAGFFVASVSTVALVLIALTYFVAAKFPIHPPLVPRELIEVVPDRWGRITANLIGVMFAFHGVAFLGGRLPYRISQARILYDEILERMGEGIVAIDRGGRIVLANAELRRLLNWTFAGPLVGRRYEQILRRREDRQVLEVLARGEDVQAELELQLRGRGRVPVEAKTTVLHDRGGRVRGVVGIFRDLSLRRRLEEMEVRLARLKDIEEMALGIAHEVRNPLGSIKGAVQELAEHALDDPADQRLAAIVRSESNRLDGIIQEFLDFARMRPPIRRRLDLRELVEETAILLARRPDAEGVEVECPEGDPCWVDVDPDQIRQAFLNIGVNALEAMGGSGRLRFAFHSAQLPSRTPMSGAQALGAQDGIEVAVENDGPPLDPDVAERVFTPFFTTKSAGLGLGMAISQKVVRHHGGDISCNRPGSLSGACFRVVLPLAEAEAA